MAVPSECLPLFVKHSEPAAIRGYPEVTVPVLDEFAYHVGAQSGTFILRLFPVSEDIFIFRIKIYSIEICSGPDVSLYITQQTPDGRIACGGIVVRVHCEFHCFRITDVYSVECSYPNVSVYILTETSHKV